MEIDNTNEIKKEIEEEELNFKIEEMLKRHENYLKEIKERNEERKLQEKKKEEEEMLKRYENHIKEIRERSYFRFGDKNKSQERRFNIEEEMLKINEEKEMEKEEELNYNIDEMFKKYGFIDENGNKLLYRFTNNNKKFMFEKIDEEEEEKEIDEEEIKNMIKRVENHINEELKDLSPFRFEEKNELNEVELEEDPPFYFEEKNEEEKNEEMEEEEEKELDEEEKEMLIRHENKLIERKIDGKKYFIFNFEDENN